jgi:integrase/recombinase XerD
LNSKETIKQYTWYLKKFLEFYHIKGYDSLTTIEPNKLQTMIEDYVMDLKKRYSPNSLPTFYYPLQTFFEANDIELKWKKIKRLLPKKVKLSGDEAYTTQDIKKILDFAITQRNRALIHFLASSGVRVGAITGLCLRHLTEIQMGCKSVLIYDDSTEEYHTFLTPEASKAIDEYFNQRRKDGEHLTPDSPVFRENYQVGIQKPKFMTIQAVQGVIWRCTKQGGLRETKKGNRYSKQLDHSFRKRFNTILKLNKEINPNIIEKMMGHEKGLDGVYLKPTKEEMFEEFKKGMADLTIDDSERVKAENFKLQLEKSTLEKKNEQLNEALRKVDELWADKQRMENPTK